MTSMTIVVGNEAVIELDLDQLIINQFRDLLDELVSCGGAEAQSLVRPKVFEAFRLMPPELQERTRAQCSNHRALDGTEPLIILPP